MAVDAWQIERLLLQPGSHYLITSFGQPFLDRERELRIAADRSGLDGAIETLRSELSAGSDFTQLWLALLSQCADQLPFGIESDELRAVVAALEDASVAADTGIRKFEFWTAARSHLSRLRPARTIGLETLRGRRWQHVRMLLADVLARLGHVEPTLHLIPRIPRAPQTFGKSDYEHLHDELSIKQSGLVVLAAPPGHGKTELALSYGAESAQAGVYDHVFWLRADEPTLLESDFLAAARILVGGGGDIDPATLRRDGFLALEQQERWLLIFDSVSDPALLLPYVPRNSYGHVLCTYSVGPNDPNRGAWQRYFDFNLDESEQERALVPQIGPEETIRMFGDTPIDPEPLLRKTGGSRLAIMLASKWVDVAERGSLADYLRQWDKEEARLRQHNINSPGAVAASIMLPLLSEDAAQVSGLLIGREAMTLLERVESFAAAAIPARALTHEVLTPKDAPIDDQRLVYLEYLGLAVRLSRIPHMQSFEIHQVIREAIRATTTYRANRSTTIAEAGRTLLSELFVIEQERPQDSQAEALPHAVAVADAQWRPSNDSCAVAGVRPITAIELYSRAAAVHWTAGRAREAGAQIRAAEEVFHTLPVQLAQLLTAADEDWEGVAWEDPLPRPAERLWRLVSFLRKSGYLSGALRIYSCSEALWRDSKQETATPDQYAHLLFEGALCFRERGGGDGGDLEVAFQLLRQAQEIWKVGQSATWLAASEALIGLCLLDKGQLEEALSRQRVALDMRSRFLKEASQAGDRPRLAVASADVGRSNYLYGRTVFYLGDVEAARDHFRDAVDHWERAVPSTKPSIHRASARSSLALMEAFYGEPEAVSHAADALKEAEEAYGRDHRDSALVHANYAEVLRRSGRECEAYTHHQRAAAMCGRHWGVTHPIYLRVRRDLAESARSTGALHEATRILLAILREYSVSDRRGRAAISQAQALSSLGRVLLDSAPNYRVTEPYAHVRSGHNGDDSWRLLDLAFRCFDNALNLINRSTNHDRLPRFEVVQSKLGMLEILLRQRRLESVDLAHRVLSEAADVMPGSVLQMISALKLLRAEAINGASSSDLRGRLGALIQEVDWPARPMAAADRLEFALARCEVMSSERPGSADASDATTSEVQRDFKLALKPLRSQIGDASHSLVALSYSALAELADRNSGPRQKARNEREQDRFRVSFDISPYLGEIDEFLAVAFDEDGPLESTYVQTSPFAARVSP
jgi:tetratricopeptide (TPR) repeat protein